MERCSFCGEPIFNGECACPAIDQEIDLMRETEYLEKFGRMYIDEHFAEQM